MKLENKGWILLDALILLMITMIVITITFLLMQNILKVKMQPLNDPYEETRIYVD